MGSMLGTEEENGGVKRMLGVCSEFERIAKVVLDKAEKDSSSRRKRKNNEEQTGKSRAPPVSNMQQGAPPPQTPMGPNAQIPAVFWCFLTRHGSQRRLQPCTEQRLPE